MYRVKAYKGFTLIELLIVVAIISILAAIAVPNFLLATKRARQAQCASNLKVLAEALISYRIDWNRFPYADGISGTGDSRHQTEYGNGPAANGYWDGVPNILVDEGYISSRNTLFCPVFRLRQKERAENFRYAYNASASDTGGFGGGTGMIDGAGASGGKIWLAKCLHLNIYGFNRARFVYFPHGEEEPDRQENIWGKENVLWNNGSVTLEDGAKP